MFRVPEYLEFLDFRIFKGLEISRGLGFTV